jgi:type IV pilus assembly protein PilM
MVDWKQDIKVGDLVKRARRAPKTPQASQPAQERTSLGGTTKESSSGPRLRRGRRAGGHKSFVGLKVGASKVAAARVDNNGSAELVQIAQEPLEAGVVVGGELREPDALAQALTQLFVQHGLPRRGVRLGIATNRIGVRAFDLAGVDDPKKLSNAIRFRAQEVLPIPIDQAVLDYRVLSEGVNEAGQLVRRVLLVVAYRDLIDRYVAACHRAGLELVGVDLEAFALLRALGAPALGAPAEVEGGEAAALVAVSIGHDRSTLAVSDGRVCEFTRVLEWGGGSLNVAIARARNITPSEAEPIKRSLVLGPAAPAGVEGDEHAGVVREAVQREIQSFAREIVSSLQYYQSQPGSLGIGEIAVTGGTAHLRGLPEQLQPLIGVDVRVGDPLARVRLAKGLTVDQPVGGLAVAIGLGIEV